MYIYLLIRLHCFNTFCHALLRHHFTHFPLIQFSCSTHLLYHLNSFQDSFDDGISSANNGYGYYSFKYDGIVVRNDNFTEMIATETLGTFVDCPTCPAKKRSTTIQSSLMKSDGKYSSPLTGSTLTLIAALGAYLFVTF